MLRIKQLPTFDSVAAAEKPSSICPWAALPRRLVGAGQHAVAANAITNLVDDVVIKINGKPQRTHTGDQLNQLNGINGTLFLASASGTNGQADRRIYLPIWFAEPWRKNRRK